MIVHNIDDGIFSDAEENTLYPDGSRRMFLFFKANIYRGLERFVSIIFPQDVNLRAQSSHSIKLALDNVVLLCVI